MRRLLLLEVLTTHRLLEVEYYDGHGSTATFCSYSLYSMSQIYPLVYPAHLQYVNQRRVSVVTAVPPCWPPLT